MFKLIANMAFAGLLTMMIAGTAFGAGAANLNLAARSHDDAVQPVQSNCVYEYVYGPYGYVYRWMCR